MKRLCCQYLDPVLKVAWDWTCVAFIEGVRYGQDSLHESTPSIALVSHVYQRSKKPHAL